ncbi:MAG: hypothetical protein IJ484_02490, partial [Oscillospiraceae bacterium]|nr:hypothetical protein [Oscillospiraceae bacterium]
DRVECVEFLAGAEGALRPVICGVSAFDTDADVLADLLLEHSGGEVIDEERGYSLQFPAIGIGVYRETTPADVQQMIGEMQADGIPTEDNEDVAAELRRASRWATLGAGVAGYYRR